MTGSEPNLKLQSRIEVVIRALAPLLDLVIAAGDRASQVLDRGTPHRPQAGPPDRQLPVRTASGAPGPQH